MPERMETDRKLLDCVRERERLNERLGNLPTYRNFERLAILRAIGEVTTAPSRALRRHAPLRKELAMPSISVRCRPGCNLPHWRRGERFRWFFSTVRCTGKP